MSVAGLCAFVRVGVFEVVESMTADQRRRQALTSNQLGRNQTRVFKGALKCAFSRRGEAQRRGAFTRERGKERKKERGRERKGLCVCVREKERTVKLTALQT